MVNGSTKTIVGVFSITKSLQQFSVFDSLPLVQIKYSLNNFLPQPETNDALNGLATSIS